MKDAVYLRDGRYEAAEHAELGDEGLVTLVAGESRADDLARKFNEEIEEESMASKKSKKNGKPKAEKKARAPKAKKEMKAKERDPRLPAAGTILRKEYNGKTYEVRVNEGDFTYDGDRYKSLSAVSHVITERKFAHGISGFVFFKAQLAEKGGAEAA